MVARGPGQICSICRLLQRVRNAKGNVNLISFTKKFTSNEERLMTIKNKFSGATQKTIHYTPGMHMCRSIIH